MDSARKAARLLQHEIGRTLLTRWDPIGIHDEPAAANEYDSYVGGVYRLLASGAPASEIAEHLAGLEAGILGHPDTDPRMLIPVANELRRVYARHRSSEGREVPDEPPLRSAMRSLGSLLLAVGTLTALTAAGVLIWARYHNIVEYLGILVYALFAMIVVAAGVVLAGIALRIAAKSNPARSATDQSGNSRSAV